MGCASSTPELTSDDKLSNTYKRARLSQNLVQQTNKVDPLTRYEVVKRIGIGSMGYVSTVKKIGDNQDGHLYAMKTLRPGRMTREFIAELKNEIRSVRKLDHPSIVRFHEVYYGKQISLIMDYCAGGDVYGRMPYTEVQAVSIVKQVLEALRYMHKRGYVHLDIKCENIMYITPHPDAPVKVIDFGFATRYDPSNGPLHKQVGTFDTMAPEVYGGNYTSQADLWSAGVVAFELISGKKPFAASSQLQVIGKVANGEFYLNNKTWKEKSEASKEFVKALIKKDPKQRLDAEGAIAHKWIRDMPARKRTWSKSIHMIGDEILKYGEAPTLKKIGMLMIAHKTFPEEIVKLREQFARFDMHNRGVVTQEEFGKALHEINQEYTDEEIQRIFHSIDAYENGVIAYTEFVAAMLEKYVYLTEDRIADAFERIDVTNSGFISIDNLRHILGQDFSEEKAKDIISQIDHDGDGKMPSEDPSLTLFHHPQYRIKSFWTHFERTVKRFQMLLIGKGSDPRTALNI
eukprot:scaffold19102_cov172-Amphora_coffeaeformis.AAC.3